jgi:signal peptidase II
MKSPLVIAQLSALLLAFSLDRLSKNWVLHHLQETVARPLVDGFIQLHLTQNTGAAFSLGRDNGQLMTIVATLVTVGLITWTFWRHKVYANKMLLEKIGTGLLLGGALGNLFDRFSMGQVTDFLQFTFIDFPIFNIADALIDVGIGLIFIDMMRSGKSLTAAAPPAPQAEKQ